MKHGVGASAHGNVESHGIEESIPCGKAARQHTVISVFVVSECVLHNLAGSILKQLYAVLVGGKYRAVSWQTESYRLGKGVHRVCREHT